MLKIELTTAIKRDLKKYKHQKEVLFDLQEIIEFLAKRRNLPTKTGSQLNWSLGKS